MLCNALIHKMVRTRLFDKGDAYVIFTGRECLPGEGDADDVD